MKSQAKSTRRWTRVDVGFWILIVGVLAWAAYPFLTSVPLEERWSVPYVEATADAAATDRPLLIFFSSPACPACRQMSRVLADDGVRRELDAFVLTKVDAWSDADLAGRYGVQALPTFVIADAHGKPGARQVGAVDVGAFVAFLKEERLNDGD